MLLRPALQTPSPPWAQLVGRRSVMPSLTGAPGLQLATVVGMGVAPSRIVYANPCKRPRDVRTAAKLGVDLTTFDTVCELEKLAEWHPSTAVLLRIRADDPAARCPLGHKYGAEEPVIESLLQVC